MMAKKKPKVVTEEIAETAAAPVVSEMVVSAKALREALALLRPVVSGRATLPILANVLLRCEEGVLELEATDLEVWMTARLLVQGRIEPITVPYTQLVGVATGANQLLRIARFARDGTEHITVTSERGRQDIAGLPATEWPQKPQSNADKHVSLAGVTERLAHITTAASVDQARAMLTGILINPQGGAIAATNGDRLHLIRSEAVRGVGSKPEDAVIIPARAVNAVLRVAAKYGAPVFGIVRTEKVASQCVFRWDAVEVLTRTIEGSFPNYNRVVPIDFEYEATVPTTEFRALVETAERVMKGTDHKKAEFTFNADAVRIVADDEEGQRFEVSLGCRGRRFVEATDQATEFRIAFNATYLHDALAAIQGPEATLRFSGLESAMLIEEGDFLALIMPMNVEQAPPTRASNQPQAAAQAETQAATDCDDVDPDPRSDEDMPEAVDG